jgi:hypothetical protein
MKAFQCTCSNTLYFENSHCLQCGLPVGFDPGASTMVPLMASSSQQWCNNGIQHGVCNWLVPRNATGAAKLCPACQLNRTIPNLGIAGNLSAWGKFERAKRRALYSIRQLQLPLRSRAADPLGGLAFDFLLPTPAAPVMTGHQTGVITMNLEEASDAVRERNRELLHEPYRTLLGHFRHELAHYYWYQWFEKPDSPRGLLEAFRAVFGNETQNYAACLQRHYQNGPLPGWQLSFVSGYATMHPWEDWAETWAHYMHITDALETSSEFGIFPVGETLADPAFDPASIVLPPPFNQNNPAEFLEMIHRWSALSPALNEISSSLGQRNLYPFVHSTSTVRKLYLVHCMIHLMQRNLPTQGPAAAPVPALMPKPGNNSVQEPVVSKNLQTPQPQAMRKE